MKTARKYSKFIPYFYFIAVIAFWFTDVNRAEGATAFPILLFGLPFLWQIIKPNSKLNITLGIAVVCSILYLILSNILGFFHMTSATNRTTDFVVYGGLFVLLISAIEIWIVNNSLQRSY